MELFIQILFPFFSTPKSYEDVLRKLASFAFYETYFITLILRSDPQIELFFLEIETWEPIGPALTNIPHTLNPAGFGMAILVAFLSFWLQIHNLISTSLGIRRRFDITYILRPLANAVGAVNVGSKLEAIKRNRNDLMRSVFYQYASSRAASPLVDKHDIEHALNAWSWFWVFIEGILYFGIAALIAFITAYPSPPKILLTVAFAMTLAAAFQSRRLKGFARPQVSAISSNPVEAAKVKQIFDAL